MKIRIVCLCVFFLNCANCTPEGNCLWRPSDNSLICSCCKTGYNGFNCTEICLNCEARLLESDNRCIQSCKGGYYGTDCDIHCSSNCNEGNSGEKLCKKDDGECVNGCVPGHFGQQCNLFCSSGCHNRECVQKDGRCNKCNGNNYYGDDCSIPCPAGCFNETCTRNGVCIDGCKHTYHGETCAGFCGVNCKNRRCTSDSSTGFTCTDGCNTGYYGDTCARLCGIYCKNQRCTSDGSTGFTCTYGCEEGYTSMNCTDKCSEYCHICQQYNGSCSTCVLAMKQECENDDCVNGYVSCRPVYEAIISLIPVSAAVLLFCKYGKKILRYLTRKCKKKTADDYAELVSKGNRGESSIAVFRTENVPINIEQDAN